MKMKKLLAVVLTGVMAVSMLTGCATLDARNIASDLEGMLKVVNDKATVSATNDAKELAEKAAKAVQADTTEWVAPASDSEDSEETTKVSMEAAVKAKLDTDKITNKYVWYACYKSEDVKNAAQAQKIYNLLVDEDEINTNAALNHDKVASIAVGDKNYQPKAGNKFELGLKTFEKKEGDKKVEYTVVIVTCKAVASETEARG